MNKTPMRLAAPALALIVGIAAIGGCSKDPQEKYNDAIEQLKEARASRDDAQEQLKSKKEELAELQASLDKAQGKLKDAGQTVNQASQNVDKTVNDQVLFRTIQRDLLNKDSFDKAAISVGVKNRVVMLTGNVPDEDTHKKALKIARSQAGVKSVKDSLVVTNEQAKKQKPQKQPANDASQQDGSAGGAGGNSGNDGDGGTAKQKQENQG